MRRWLSFITAAAGSVACVLRGGQLRNGFEPDTGLPVMEFYTVALIAFTLLFLLVGVVFCACLKPQRFATGADAFSPPREGRLALLDGLIPGVLMLAAGAAGLYQYATGADARLSRLIFYVFALAAGLCLFLSARAREGDRKAGTAEMLVLIPAFFCCLWMVLVYQGYSTDPVLLDYVYELLAVISIALGFYGVAGASFGQLHPRRFVFFSMAAEYFILITLVEMLVRGDLAALPMGLLYWAALCHLAGKAGLLLRGPGQQEEAVSAGQPANEEKGETE